jgi:hypothetical protein
MIIHSFILEVSYSQFAIFDPRVENPFNEWADDHVKQGFSWRKNSACFRTLIEDGEHILEVNYRTALPDLYPSSTRAILVPVPRLTDQKLEIASINDSKILTMPHETSGILVQLALPSSNERASVMVTLLSGFQVDFAILRTDSEIKKVTALLKHASPAV